ncbi:MAG: hypothetical protein H8D89_01515 [Dehalococcoidia bacterium]|nr:hypothetical protein [Dehalococcoidia bacterium]MBL7124991.1 hypothetical protein [Dehalococcoidales bacterium]
MAKLLEKPEELKVSVNIQGVPLTLVRNGEAQRITKVYQHWRAVEQWLEKEILRNYFRVKTTRGLVCDIYRDMPTGCWYLSRIYD